MDFIKRETVCEELNDIGGCGADPNSWADGWDRAISAAIKIVKDTPAADVAPVRHGHWIFGTTNGHSWQKCSECCVLQSGQTLCFSYCPNCGAKMDGGEEK